MLNSVEACYVTVEVYLAFYLVVLSSCFVALFPPMMVGNVLCLLSAYISVGAFVSVQDDFSCGQILTKFT